MHTHTIKSLLLKFTVSIMALISSLLISNVTHAQTDEQSFSYGGQTVTYSQTGNISFESFSDDTEQSPDRALRYEFDDGFRIVEADGPRLDVTDIVSIDWFDDGRTQIVTNPLEHHSVFEYDEDGQILLKTNANNVRTSFTYLDGRLSSYTTADGTALSSTTSLTYDEGGDVSSITLPSGRVLTELRGEEGQMTPAALAVFKAIQNAMRADPVEGLYRRNSRDDKQALARDLSRGIAQEDATFDELGRLTQFSDAAGGVTELKYDAYDNLKKVIDPRGVVTRYKYDGFGQLLKEISAERGTTTYQYDEAGNLTREAREGGLIVIRKYDEINRMTREVFKQNGSDKKVTNYNYDSCAYGIGRVCRINADGHVTRFSYNELGQYTQVSTKYDGQDEFEVSRYGYGPAGRLETVHYPTDLVVSYHYTDAGLVDKITGKYGADDEKERFVIAKNIAIDPDKGRLDALTFGNGIRSVMQYDEDNRLSRHVTRKDGDVLDRAVYRRDDKGNITKINRLNAEQSQNFTYDALSRLTAEERGASAANTQSRSYGYDAAGNRTASDDGTRSKFLSYAPDANRLETINRQTLSYDERGNLLLDRNERRQFGYDVTNRLSEYSENNELVASYAYNAMGQRIQKTRYRSNDDGNFEKTVNFAYTPDGWLLSEIGRDNRKDKLFTEEYVWLNGRPIAKLSRRIAANGNTRKAEVTYLHTDHLATPRSATNEAGETVWSWESDAFGADKAERDPDGDGNKTRIRLRFPGQYYDDESGLHYNHHRDYDPKLGRYIQSDPIGLWGGVNRYGYVGGNAVNWIDPEGLSGCGPNPNECVVTGIKKKRWTPIYLPVTVEFNPDLFRWSPDLGGGGGGGQPPEAPEPECPGFVDGLIQGLTGTLNLQNIANDAMNNDSRALFIMGALGVGFDVIAADPSLAREFALDAIYSNRSLFLGRVIGSSSVSAVGAYITRRIAAGAGYSNGWAIALGFTTGLTNATTTQLGVAATTLGAVYDRLIAQGINPNTISTGDIGRIVAAGLASGSIAIDPETGEITVANCQE